VSTPSRSRQATRTSLPDMGGRLPRVCRRGAFFVSVVSLVFAHSSLAVVAAAAAKQKTHDRCQPWVPIENLFLASTRANGAVPYDDDRHCCCCRMCPDIAAESIRRTLRRQALIVKAVTGQKTG